MRAWLLLVTGCGRIAFDPIGGTGDDVTNGDGGTDGNNATGCLAAWHSGPTLSAPTRIAELATTGADTDPWLSDDERTIYFASINGNNSDLFVAERATSAAMFGPRDAAPFANINGNQNELRPWLLPDEGTLFYVTANGATGFDLARSERGDKTQAFPAGGSAAFANVNTAGADMDPAVSADQLRLYYTMPPQTSQSVGRATRMVSTVPFNGPSMITELDDAAADLDPAPSRDELVIVWSRLSGGSFDLFYAVRESLEQPFGPAMQVPTINNGTAEERDPFVSADGCTLYFSSNRTGNDDLWFAKVL